MIKFSIADYCEHDDIIRFFLSVQQNMPEAFYDNRRVDSLFGLPSHLIWNGGRVMVPRYDPLDYFKIVEQFHSDFPEISIRHTCTNCVLKEEHYNDYLCNQWLKYFENDNDAVIVNQDALGEYIKKHYPKYDIMYSTTKGINTVEDYNKYSENHLIVLNYTHNHDESLISQLKYPKNIEILCAEECIDNCPVRALDYESISRVNLHDPTVEMFDCPHGYGNLNFYTEVLGRGHAITNEYIDYLYQTYSIENFKIQGRKTSPVTYVESFVYYLIKPEWRDIIRNTALMIIFNIPPFALE